MAIQIKVAKDGKEAIIDFSGATYNIDLTTTVYTTSYGKLQVPGPWGNKEGKVLLFNEKGMHEFDSAEEVITD